MKNEKEILKDILAGEGDMIQNLSEIIKKAKEFFLIEETSGKILFKNFSKLKNHQKICALLIGKDFSKRLDIIENNSMSGSEISNELNIPQTTLSAPLKSLKEDGFILSEKNKYRINSHRIEEIIDSFKK
jgi:biotin operon repressor